jgi:transposase
VHEKGRVMGGGFVGIDVSKDRLDVAFRPGGEDLQVANDRRGIARLARTLQGLRPELVELEASGGYEAPLLERLLVKQLPVALLNPPACTSVRTR